MSNIPRTELTLKSVEFFGNRLTSKGKSPNTVKAYKADLTEFFRWVEFPYSVSASDFDDTAELWLNKFRRIVSPKTTGRRLTSLRAFARWAGIPEPLEGYSAPVPARSIPHPIPERIEGVLAMLAATDAPQQQALISLCGLVGARVSEALSIGPDSFDLGEMLLTIRGKGDRTRVVPISEMAWTHLAPCLLDARITGRATLVTYHDRFARKLITDIAASIPLSRHVASHDLRATFATALNDAGANLRVIQEILGHASSTTTEGYTLVRVTQMKDAVKLI